MCYAIIKIFRSFKNPKLILNLLPDIEKEEFQHYGLEGFFHEKIVQVFKEKNIDPQHIEIKILDTMSIEKHKFVMVVFL